MEDSFNASGRARARKRKAMTMARQGARTAAESAVNPMAIPKALAQEASQGKISAQAKEAWSGVDGFDNATGKKLTKNQKMIGIAAATIIIGGALVFAIVKMRKKKGK